ncbi:MAG TPA: transglycosylase domain-containing protein [Propionibacteriaceae bacterium]|nr:transglycosylase domain-containing protein [Propionibacteriaceae bacterium]
MAKTPAPRRSSGSPAAKPSKSNGAKRKAPTKGRTWVKRGLVTVLILGLVGSLIGTLAAVAFYRQVELPDPNADFQTNTTFLYYRDGSTKLGSLSVQNRQTLSYDKMPQVIKDAVVAAENRTFWTDRGISPRGMARSAWTIVRGGEMSGGSTITQQYIKILYLTSDRTMTRKLRELVLAVKMGKERTKEEVLQGYLNTIYFGRGAYGIEAASKAYFNVSAEKLTIPQAAVLASVLNNPSLFDPSAGEKNKERLFERYGYVLDGMLEMGSITQAEHAKHSAALPKFPDVPLNTRYGGTKGFLMRMVEDELATLGFTDAQIQGGGLRVTTTFDETLQEAAVEYGQEYKELVGANAKAGAKNLHPAIASVKVDNGDVLAIYGGDDYVTNSRNWATTDRSAASSFKTWAMIAGLRDEFSLRSMLNGNTFTPDGDSSTVRNEFSMQYGPVTLLRAITDSINTAFVDLTQQIPNGPAEVIKAANDAGIPTGAGWDENNRISLGTAEVSPLDNAAGYATLANEGRNVGRHVVNEVKDLNGKVVYTFKPDPRQSIEADIAADVTYSLTSVVNQGTGGRVRALGFDIAGKTGTAGVEDEIRSAWFVAYTRQISTSVMFVAGEGGTGDLDPYKRPGDGTFFGGTYPAMLWADFMKVALKGLENEPFPDPVFVNNGKAPSVTPTTTQPTATVSTPPASTPPPPSSSAPVTTSAPPPPASSATTTSAPPPATATTTTTKPVPTPPGKPGDGSPTPTPS